jgi:FAD-dependent urate hydroxylase
MSETDIAVIGAGPYGLAAAAHLRRAGAEVRVLGDPMSFWRGMPQGMLLRSNWTATCIGEYEGPLSLDSYRTATGASFDKPVPLEHFIEYGTWVAGQVAPDVDRRTVHRLEGDGDGFRLLLTDDGKPGQPGGPESELRARRVVVAAGIAPFANRPAVAQGLPPELASHSSEHTDLGKFSGQRVLVVGGGQSALESAALLHEGGAQVEVIVRADHLNWLHGGKYHRMLGRLAPLVYAPTDVGPLGLSRLVAVPGAFTALPRRLQEPLAYRSIRPAAATWLGPRLRDVPITMSRSVASVMPQQDGLLVTLAGGQTRAVDHLLLGTGYRVDITKYPFLAPSLLDRIERAGGYPVLGPGLQSSVPGLHFLGAPASWSFGPTMRFVSGGWFTARALTRVVAGAGRPGSRPASRPPVSTASDPR